MREKKMLAYLRFPSVDEETGLGGSAMLNKHFLGELVLKPVFIHVVISLIRASGFRCPHAQVPRFSGAALLKCSADIAPMLEPASQNF